MPLFSVTSPRVLQVELRKKAIAAAYRSSYNEMNILTMLFMGSVLRDDQQEQRISRVA